MTPRITLVHGWGYDATLWREVLPLLADLDVEVADLGFFGHPSLPEACEAPRIAVGHSLGVLWWLVLANLSWTRLVAINGFPRFTAVPDFPQGVAPRVLERMRKRFATAPAAVLADFQIACGGAGPALPNDAVPLAQGLAKLADSDGRAALAEKRQNILALAARHDAIVPAAMSEAAFAALPADRLRWTDDGGHLLPLTCPHECAALIREAVA
ncbi:MAG: hypothetical protein PHQ05_10535 [Sterolibacterium sp.]|nr:hypothetical protein [Sterolibacterium sp.]